MFQRLVTPLCTVLLTSILFFTGVLDYYAEITLDILFQIRGERVTSQKIVIIGIDDDTLKQFGPWPFSRKLHAELLQSLGHAEAVIFDMLFTDPAPEDVQFRQAISEAPPVVVGTARTYNDKYLSPSPVLQDYVVVGSIETVKDKRGIVRKAAPTTDIASLSLAAVRAADDHDFQLKPGSLINFYGAEFTFLYIPYVDVIQKKLPENFFNGRYVFIGAQAVGMGDVHITPYNLTYSTPGVEIQATLLNNLLDGSAISDQAHAALGLAFFMLVFTALFTGNREAYNLITIGGVSLVSLLVSYSLFLHNRYLNISLPLSVLYLGYGIHLCYQMIWINKSLLLRIINLDASLNRSIQSLHNRIPQLTNSSDKNRSTGFSLPLLKKHINTLEDTVSALTLQSHFVNHLIREESAPLALWSKEHGSLFFSNSSLDKLWQTLSGRKLSSFTFNGIVLFLNTHLAKGQYELTISQIDNSTAEIPTVIEISVAVKGLTRNFNVSLQSIVMEESSFCGYMAGFSEVTRIRQIERVKSDVLSIMSHELKLPLTTILGYSELLEDKLAPEHSAYVKKISSHTRQLNALIESFLNLERLESGKLGETYFPCDLVGIVTDAITAAEHQAAVKEIEIQFSIPQKVSPVMGDEILLVQCFLNLLDNAVKFSPERTGISVIVSEKVDEIEVEVCDRGIGIPEDKVPVIFDRFIRVEDVKAAGFGLGLSFVKQVVENHNGRISVRNNRQAGVTFTLSLPKLTIP